MDRQGADNRLAEFKRLEEDCKREKNWKRWGPYLSERQWSTVREDYSAGGTCWEYFPHDHARSRAYRWGEDGLMGWTDRECRVCFSIALWNGQDSILKERLFGLTGNEGNHGEDVKEEYFYLDSTPTHSYAHGLYRYPQAAFPYDQITSENHLRGKDKPEFEILDTGVFAEKKYFDVHVEYACGSPDETWIRITVENAGPAAAQMNLLPTVWFRNTWSWGCNHEGCELKPTMMAQEDDSVRLIHRTLGDFVFESLNAPAEGFHSELLFTENETNYERLYGTPSASPYVKDAFHEYVIRGQWAAVSPKRRGTKAALNCVLTLGAGEKKVLYFRLAPSGSHPAKAADAEAVFLARMAEADEFHQAISPQLLTPLERSIIRQAYAGLLWTKQFYHYVVADWLHGDPDMPIPPSERLHGRNADWDHVFSRDVLSVPDKWEYPWFAAWDLAFHMVPFAHLDPTFAKGQLSLLLREWYMHPNGQLPAYEFALGDVNPPVHAWAAWRVYKISGADGHRDRDFLESVFQKLLLNFTWWVNRKDAQGRNLFGGGFLGLDNIGVFDRSKPMPGGGQLQQADGTAWMAFYCATMMAMALELALEGDRLRPAYEDMASKFLEHFVTIIDAINREDEQGLWDETDGFYYDRLILPDGVHPLRVPSLVALLPIIAVEVLEEERLQALPGFNKRLKWFLEHRPKLSRHIIHSHGKCHGDRRLLAVASREKLVRLLGHMLSEDEFLSPFGIRSLSKTQEKNPFKLEIEGQAYTVEYNPGESTSGMFGGNSNWRGPIWFPINYLLIEALERYHHFYDGELKVELPTGSGNWATLDQVAQEIERRMVRLFVGDDGKSIAHRGPRQQQRAGAGWNEHALFHEYFHAETGEGLGASHQTGWTALVIRMIKDVSTKRPYTEDAT